MVRGPKAGPFWSVPQMKQELSQLRNRCLDLAMDVADIAEAACGWRRELGDTVLTLNKAANRLARVIQAIDRCEEADKS
jgi:hypothetical protein